MFESWGKFMKPIKPEKTDLMFWDYAVLDGKVAGAADAIKTAWLQMEPSPWAVSWSGGKDSTATLKLLATAVLSLPESERTRRKVYVVSADTRMENPNIEEYLHTEVKAFNTWASNNGLLFEAMLVSRPPEHGFFYSVLGKGYTLPDNSSSRWCTHKLKIEPQKRKRKELGVSLSIVGTRMGESIRRDGIIGKYATESIYWQTSHGGEDILCPVVEFTIEDIWAYLQSGLPWTQSLQIQTLYKEATGECGFSNPQGATEPVKACGARFGCWTCPPIGQDKSTEKMSETHRWMQPLTEWRSFLKLIYGEYLPPKPEGAKRAERSIQLQSAREQNSTMRLQTRSGFMRDGHQLKPGQGCLRIAARERLMARLLLTQDNVNTLRVLEGLAPIRLIDEEETALIYQQWKEDTEQRPWLI